MSQSLFVEKKKKSYAVDLVHVSAEKLIVDSVVVDLLVLVTVLLFCGLYNSCSLLTDPDDLPNSEAVCFTLNKESNYVEWVSA